MGRGENGNAAENTLNNDLLTRLSQEMAKLGLSPGAYLYIADSAMVTQANLAALGDRTRFITRLPANYSEHGRVIGEAVKADVWTEIGRLAVTKPTKNRLGGREGAATGT